ncbi:MAG: hypothetical protein ACT4PZ_19845 [Panacagrimonas sp.]
MKVALCVFWSLALIAGGFTAGGGYGWHVMDEKCGLLALSILPSSYSYSLEKHLTALDALADNDLATVKAILLKLSRLEASSIDACKKDPACMKYAPQHLSSETTLERVKNFER